MKHLACIIAMMCAIVACGKGAHNHHSKSALVGTQAEYEK